MGERLKDRVAIVTGAGRGIGRGVAMLLAEERASVVVNDLGANVDGTDSSSGPADEVVAEIRSAGGTAVANHDSVATFDGAGGMVNTALANFGRVDILCHVAGILRDRMIFNMAEEEWDAVLAVHLRGAFNTVRQVVPHMIDRNYGRICLFSSGSGLGNTGQGELLGGQGGYGRLCPVTGPGTGLLRHHRQRDLSRWGNPDDRHRAGNRAGIAGRPGVIGGGQMAGRTQDMEQAARDPLNNAPKVVYLCTEAGGQVTGQVIGTTGWQMSLYSPRHVIRSIHKDGRWTLDELEQLVPISLASGIVNPAPAPEPGDTGA